MGRDEQWGKWLGGEAEVGEGQTAAGAGARGAREAGSEGSERAEAGEWFNVNICVGF